MICKISPLLKFEILGVFVNTLTADDNYPFGFSGFAVPDSTPIILKTKNVF